MQGWRSTYTGARSNTHFACRSARHLKHAVQQMGSVYVTVSAAAKVGDMFLEGFAVTKALRLTSILLVADILYPGAVMPAWEVPTLAAGDSETSGALSSLNYRPDDSAAGLASATLICTGQRGGTTPGVRQVYEGLVREYDQARREYVSALRSHKAEEQFEDAQRKKPDDAEFARRFLLLAQTHPQDPVAVDAINWPFAIGGVDSGPSAERAVDLLIKHHLRRGKFGPVCRDLAFITGRNAERLFRAALAESEDREVRAWSTFGLAQCLLVQVKQTRAADPKKAIEEAEKLYQKAAEEYGDVMFPRGLWPDLARRTSVFNGVGGAVETGRNTIADFARIKLMVLRAHRDLVVGKPAFEIQGEDTDGKPMKLSDHRGQVVVLVFFVSGDAPFKALVPHLGDLAGRMVGKPFALLGISADPERDELRGYLARERINWRSWWDGGKVAGPKGDAIKARWDIQIWPTIYVLDHRGVIRYKDIVGGSLDDAVETLLKERAAAKPGRSDTDR
jgi:peroxiredoxin